MIAIYKLCKLSPDHMLGWDEKLLMCKNMLSKSKTAIHWTICLANTVQLDEVTKLNLYSSIDKNKLYWRSKIEMKRLSKPPSAEELQVIYEDSL